MEPPVKRQKTVESGFFELTSGNNEAPYYGETSIEQLIDESEKGPEGMDSDQENQSKKVKVEVQVCRKTETVLRDLLCSRHRRVIFGYILQLYRKERHELAMVVKILGLGLVRSFRWAWNY